jgi:transcriptional regulator with XRE-family HTH domain
MDVGTTSVAADLIQSALRFSGLSQAELARRAGMPRSVLNAYVRNTREPGADALARIVGAAGRELRAAPAVRTVDVERAGRLLVQVLELAEHLPTRRRGRLTFPPLSRAAA